MTSLGAQRERTSLAWRRTALAFAVNGVLLLRAADAWVQVAGLLVLATASGIAAVGAATFREADTLGGLAGRGAHGSALLAVTAAIGVLDLIAIVR